MGKRSDFKRVERDYYPTPEAAVVPLIPHLPDGLDIDFIEPCAGDGRLAGHIERLTKGRVTCSLAIDVEPQGQSIVKSDAFDMNRATIQRHAAAMIITNPPWDRKVLHPLIEHLSNLAPTWLLFDADWMHTRQSAPYLPRLRKVVSVGRVKWIEDSKMTGKDNCAWYHFRRPVPDTAIEFVGRL